MTSYTMIHRSEHQDLKDPVRHLPDLGHLVGPAAPLLVTRQNGLIPIHRRLRRPQTRYEHRFDGYAVSITTCSASRCAVSGTGGVGSPWPSDRRYSRSASTSRRRASSRVGPAVM